MVEIKLSDDCAYVIPYNMDTCVDCTHNDHCLKKEVTTAVTFAVVAPEARMHNAKRSPFFILRIAFNRSLMTRVSVWLAPMKNAPLHTEYSSGVKIADPSVDEMFGIVIPSGIMAKTTRTVAPPLTAEIESCR